MAMPAEFRALLERFNQIGRLLPPDDDLDLEDPDQRAEVEVLVAEMRKIKTQIFAYLADVKARRRAS